MSWDLVARVGRCGGERGLLRTREDGGKGEDNDDVK